MESTNKSVLQKMKNSTAKTTTTTTTTKSKKKKRANKKSFSDTNEIIQKLDEN